MKSLLCLTKENENILKRSSTLRVSRSEIWLTVYRSIYLMRMQEDFNSYWACAYLCTCLPCDPTGKINSLNNEKVYHSERSLICMNEMCVNIKHGALKKRSSYHISNFKIMLEKYKLKFFTLSNDNYKNKWRGLQLYVSPERKSG